MQRNHLASALEGGYVVACSLDMCEKSYFAEVEVLDNGKLSTYDLRFTGVSSFVLEDDKASAWERLEVTEFRIEEVPEASAREEWKFWFNFWDAASLTIRCASLKVDGEGLV